MWGVDPYGSVLEILFQLGPDARFLTEEASEVDIEIETYELQEEARKLIRKIKDLEKRKTVISLEEEYTLNFYVKVLKLLYGKIDH